MARQRRQYQPQQPDDFEPWQPETAPVDDFEPWQPDPPTTDEDVARAYGGYEEKPQEWEPIRGGPQAPPDDFVPWQPEPQAPPEPEAEGALGTAARRAAHATPGTLGALAAGAAGAGAGRIAGAAAGRVVGGVLGSVLGPVGTGIGVIGGGLAGGYLADKFYEGGKELLGFDDAQQLAVNAAAHPIASAAGEVAPLALGLASGRGLQLGARALSAGLGGAAEGGMQLAQGEFDPTRLATNVAAGAALPNMRGWLGGIEARGAAAAGRRFGQPEPHGTPGSDAAGTSKEQPPPRPAPDAGAELPTDYYTKPPRVIEGEAPPAAPGEPAPRVIEGEAPPTAAQAPGPQVSMVDPAIDAAVNKRPIGPRVTEVEPPTKYGQMLDQEFPRVPQPQVIEGEAPPTAARGPEPRVFEGEAPPLAPAAPATPREAMAQRTPEETYGQVLRRLAADERGGGRLPPKPTAEEPGAGPVAKATDETMPTPGVIEGATIPGAKTKVDAALEARGFTLEQIAKMKPKAKEAILQKREGEVGAGPPPTAREQAEAIVRGPAPGEITPIEALDLKLANRMLNQPAILKSEAAKRGITPEALKAQATEALKTPALPGRPAELSPVGGGAVAPAVTPTRPPSPAMVAATGGAPPVTPPPPAAAGAPPTPPARPTLRLADAKDKADGLWAAIRRTFVPELSPSGRTGMDVFREHKGEAVQMKEAQLARFDNAMHYATNKMSDMDQRKLVNYIEGGEHLNTPGHEIHDPGWRPPEIIRKVADQIKQGYAAYEHVLSQLPQAEQAKFLEDYLTHMYKNPEPLIERIGSGAGNFGSLKKRVHETYEHAREAGLEPLTNNPIEIFTRYAMGAERAITKQKVINDLEARGYLDWFKPKSIGATGAPEPHVSGTPPEGYAPVPSFTNKKGATAYVPKDMAYMLNHQFGPTFQWPAGETIVNSLRRFKNFTTSLELGMSLYHPFTVGVETIARGMKRSIEQMGTSPDQIARASKTFIKAFGEPISNVPLGGEWIERYTGKRASSVEQARILDAMKAADIRPVGIGHTMEYDLTSSRRKTMGELGSLWTSWQRGSLERELKGSLKEIMGGDWKEGMMFVPNLASRILRTAAQPIFETYIPRMKIASLALDLQAYVAQNPLVSKEDLAAVARKMSSSIDRTMGEMVTDHIGMNKAWKSAAFIGMRSYSFTIGGPSELVGGLVSGAKGALKGENRYSMSSKYYDPKAASPIAYGVLIGGLAAMWNYMRTGEFPQDWRDTVTPRTGGVVMSGGQLSEERMLLPGYHKDFLGYAFHPKEEVSAKMAGVVNAFKEQITGRDYRGDPIAPPVSAAGLGANIAGRAEHLGKSLIPLSFKQVSEPDKVGSNIHPIEQALGFRAPGAYIQNPERIAQVKEIMEQKAWRTRERHINADRAAKGLPPLPPMRFGA